ncbi:MAG: glycosyltransferase, partial [Actinobacteria bacterium]
MTNDNLPLVSIVIVNYNGAKHIPTCLKSLKELDYPKHLVQMVIVDNASQDDSVKLLQKNYPEVKLV